MLADRGRQNGKASNHRIDTVGFKVRDLAVRAVCCVVVNIDVTHDTSPGKAHCSLNGQRDPGIWQARDELQARYAASAVPLTPGARGV